MSHYHCEIIMPPTEDVDLAVEAIMKPFYEGDEENYKAFYDWYAIGGRWAGHKDEQRLDQGKLQEFYDWLTQEQVTVSSVVCGKQSISPARQIPKVDAKWNELFPPPDGKPRKCSLFEHANDPYSKSASGALPGDICTLSEAMDVSCARVIFAGPQYDHDAEDWIGDPVAVYMLVTEEWNGVTHMPIAWDGTIREARSMFLERLTGMAEKYVDTMTPRDDWLAITVDYHS